MLPYSLGCLFRTVQSIFASLRLCVLKGKPALCSARDNPVLGSVLEGGPWPSLNFEDVNMSVLGSHIYHKSKHRFFCCPAGPVGHLGLGENRSKGFQSIGLREEENECLLELCAVLSTRSIALWEGTCLAYERSWVRFLVLRKQKLSTAPCD